MKLFLVIASVCATVCLVECLTEQMVTSTYSGGFNSGGVPNYPVPHNYPGVSSYNPVAYAAPTPFVGVPNPYAGVPAGVHNYNAVPSFGAPSHYPGVPTYAGSNSYSGFNGFGGVPGINRLEAPAAPAPASADLCMCAPAAPKICGSDHVTYSGWCNFQCAAHNKPDLKPAHLGDCEK